MTVTETKPESQTPSANGKADEPRPRTVIEALARVVAEMPGVGKNQRFGEGQGGYAYRSVDDVTRAVQPLFGRYGIVFVPREIEYRIEPVTVGGKPWSDFILVMEFTVYGPGGPEDHITIGPLTGLGRDGSDKGANKARTQIFKAALLQVLCVSDATDDGDASVHEADHRGGQPGGEALSPEAQAAAQAWESDAQFTRSHDAYAARLRKLNEAQKQALKEWKAAQGIGRWMTPHEWETTIAAVRRLEHGEVLTPSAGPGAPQAPQRPQEAPESPEGTPAPLGVPGPAEGLTEQSDLAYAAGADPALVERVTEQVRPMKLAEVDTQLDFLGLPTAGDAKSRRDRLIYRLVHLEASR